MQTQPKMPPLAGNVAHQVGGVERSVPDDDHLYISRNLPGERLEQADLLLCIADAFAASHLPPERQSATAIGQRSHQDLPPARKLHGVDENTDAVLPPGGSAKKLLSKWFVQGLWVNGFVRQQAAKLPRFTCEAGRSNAAICNPGQMYMLGLVQATHHPGEVAALRTAQIGHLLAKRLAYLTLKAKAVAHLQRLLLVSWWLARQPTYKAVPAMATVFSVFEPSSKSVR